MSWQGAIVNHKHSKLNAKALALAALIAASAGGHALAADMPLKAPPPAKPVPFFFVNDTSVSFIWYPNSTDPGVSGDSNIVPGGVFGQKNTFARYSGEIDHFDVWQYGTNFIHVEFDQYGPQDPSLGIPGAQGSREFFAIARSTLGFNEISNSKAFSNFLTKDVSLEIGGNAGVQDNFLDEHTTVGVFGLQFALNLPGVVNVSILADKEFTRNAFDTCGPAGFGVVTGPAGSFGAGACIGGGSFSGDRDFDWTWRIENFISEPLTFLPPSVPLTFINVLNVIGPKGTGISTANCLAVGCFGPAGAFNNNETKTEVFEDARLSLDASQVFWGKPGIWDAFVGYRYWYNKFGTNHNAFLFADIAPQTSIESTAYVGTTYHFK
jgi:hypothetical protein